ncbi:hypothetical protein ACHAXA_009892 [Cyclostephanos tholiformis]|uniref:Transmembrane protein n=1 Tax=Cyclostephanos tholiformis TaxID=382380 RepID=A0ABD3RW77_9STRA
MSTISHVYNSTELDADNSDGVQGVGGYVYPSVSPSYHPTYHPTLRGLDFVLRGSAWYDRNANGRRDANVHVNDMGDDVEYSHGIGGVIVQLVECDVDTGRAMSGEMSSSYASSVTGGMDATGRPRIARLNDRFGRFDIHLDGLDRYYLLDVRAPAGYLLTGGICNDDVLGWECDYGRISPSGGTTTDGVVGMRVGMDDDGDDDGTTGGEEGGGRGRRRSTTRMTLASAAGRMWYHHRGRRRLGQGQQQRRRRGNDDEGGEVSIVGIESGRSTSCVYVDKGGKVESPLNFGVMRVGDAHHAKTNVALVLDFATDHGRRGLLEDAITRGTVLMHEEGEEEEEEEVMMMTEGEMEMDEEGDGNEVREGTVMVISRTTRYLLGKEDSDAIGMVTAEVLATSLDSRLAANGVVLDSVMPKEVILSSRRRSLLVTSSSSSSSTSSYAGERILQEDDALLPSTQLAVTMEVMGHYSPPPEIDFDYIVQDSINRDTDTIRRSLREYNTNCREQTSLVEQQGLGEYDFDSIASTSGMRPTGHDRQPDGSSGVVVGGGNSFSTACSSSLVVPEFFETNLREIEAVGVSDVRFDTAHVMNNVESGLESWAQGAVAVITCFIVLLLGVLLFRRALGRRRTSAVDVDDEKNAKGPIGGPGRRGSIRFLFDKKAGRDITDDGSVDSAFYSDHEDDEDDALDGNMTKVGKIRRKKKVVGSKEEGSSVPSSASPPNPSKVSSDVHKSFEGTRRTSFDKSFKGKRRASYDNAGLESKLVGSSSLGGGFDNNPSNNLRRSKLAKMPSTSNATDGWSDLSEEASRAANERKKQSKSNRATPRKERSQKRVMLSKTPASTRGNSTSGVDDHSDVYC